MPVNRLPERKKVENETFAAALDPAPATSDPATSATEAKPRRGRPKGSGKMTIQKYAANPPSLPKTDYQRIKELRELMIHSQKAIHRRSGASFCSPIQAAIRVDPQVPDGVGHLQKSSRCRN